MRHLDKTKNLGHKWKINELQQCGCPMKTRDERLQELEEIVAHQAADIESLSQTVNEQWQQIDGLTKAFMRFRDRLTEVEDSGTGPHENTKPPHY
ncbi:MAG: SlyX family protein [Rhizobiaceae bacterium]